MIDISIVSDGTTQRILLTDVVTGASEEIVLGEAGFDSGEVTIEDEDDLSGRHQYCP